MLKWTSSMNYMFKSVNGSTGNNYLLFGDGEYLLVHEGDGSDTIHTMSCF